MRLKRGFGYLLLALAATLPALAYDFHSWRTDGGYVRGTSTNQQASNQAFNLYEQFLDAGSGTMSLYWMGELQENGGMAVPPFGNVPPTAPLLDNRPQDPEVD